MGKLVKTVARTPLHWRNGSTWTWTCASATSSPGPTASRMKATSPSALLRAFQKGRGVRPAGDKLQEAGDWPCPTVPVWGNWLQNAGIHVSSEGLKDFENLQLLRTWKAETRKYAVVSAIPTCCTSTSPRTSGTLSVTNALDERDERLGVDSLMQPAERVHDIPIASVSMTEWSSGSSFCQEAGSARKEFCQERFLSGSGLCQEGILSGRVFVRKRAEGFLSGNVFVRKRALPGRNFVRKGFCQEAGSARKGESALELGGGVVVGFFFGGTGASQLPGL